MSYELLETIAYVEWIVFAFVTTLFPLMYALNRWYATPEGRSIMAFGAAIAMILVLVVVFHHVDESRTVSLWTQVTALTLAIAASTYKLVVLGKAHVRAVKGGPINGQMCPFCSQQL